MPKRSPRKEVAQPKPRKRNLRLNAPPNQKQRGITKLLANGELLAQVREMAESGASIGTIEAAIGLPKGRLRDWLVKGDKQPKTAYRRFYNMFRKWAAQAKHAAEAQQLAKTPTQWLERNTTAKLIETEEDTSLIPTQTAVVDHSVLKIGAQSAVDAMKILVESGIDVNEALRKGMVHINDASKDISNEPQDGLEDE
jgi:hypothetical protein